MEDDLIKLKSGKEIYAHCRIIGISPTLDISGGYDQGITNMKGEWREEDDLDGMSPDDICELADIAIDRWQRLKKHVKP